ncbi:galactosyltransferase-related protein [Salimicrobium halophilum]|uniref:Glycosyltransferase like family 2 n=1 Tax=Salimicrobium halophilum TaxID=86666 RepID=A0A1G8UHA8_9BACI|nr:galactosyltransferase-related protein [Salimicrobium halophilum]SDJ53172.1 Glycosyltransferase like family 2 [Salimicrobium halophilum]
MKHISVLFPYKADHGPRDRLFEWVLAFYKNMMPDAELCIGEGLCQGDLFSRSKAINHAANQATRDVFVIADTDIFYDPAIIQEASALLEERAWVIPYYKIHKLKETSTTKILEEQPAWPISTDMTDAHIVKQARVGGLNVIPRKNFEAVSGFDERFCGWGGEDDAFGIAVNTLCGKYKRTGGEIFHLHHPTRKRKGNPDYYANRNLTEAYRANKGNKEAIKNIIHGNGGETK